MPPGQPAPSAASRDRTVAAVLAAIAFAAFARALANGFTLFDDPLYVTDNGRVLAGLTPDGVGWAFTTTRAANWHPLTWLSHMLDVSLYGQAAWGHHLTSVLLHALATALLFLALAALTGRRWPAALTAALFALHPLHVESVAWVAERKDVLCAVFWAASLLAYERYVRLPAPARYAAVLALFGLALLAKPMAVTLPLVLLLLDGWPLGRLRAAPVRRLVAEKAPLFALSLASGVVTYLAQASHGATALTERYALAVRAANAALSYAVYLGQTAWPVGLIAFYPHPGRTIAPAAVGAAVALLAALTALAALQWRRRPWLGFGWAWYLVTLLPVIGLVQVGRQAHADRYTYLPLVGVFLAVSWSLAAPARRPRLRTAVVALALVALAALAALTWVQQGYWRDTLSLFGRVVTKDARNMIAHNMTGSALLAQGRAAEAAGHFAAAVRIDPSLTDAWFNLGLARERLGDLEGARAAFDRVLAESPDDAETVYALGRVLAAGGRVDEAAERYRAALALAPAGPAGAAIHRALGILLAERGDLDAALRHLEDAARLSPGDAGSRYDLARALELAGRNGEAERWYREALRLKPEFPEALNNLGALLAGRGDRDGARALFADALRVAPGYREARANLERLGAR